MPRTTRTPVQAAVTSEMNVTPMIDVLLVVLIIYIVIAVWRHVLPVTTPPAPPPGEAPSEQTQLVLTIGAHGRFELNGQPVPAEALDEQLRSVYRDRPAKLLFVSSDPDVPYHAVIGAMARARGAGVEVLAFMPAVAQ